MTQVDQILSELEAKTERSMIPSGIATESELQTPNQDTLKDKDLTNFPNRLPNYRQLNLDETATTATNNNEGAKDDHLETDRILIQQIIYQNYVPASYTIDHHQMQQQQNGTDFNNSP